MSQVPELPGGLMPGEQPRSAASGSSEMPVEEMPRGEMMEPSADLMGASGDMPRGEMQANGGMSGSATSGEMPGMSGAAGTPGAGEMPLGLMTGEIKAATAGAEESPSGIEIPGSWRLVLYPASKS
jgi:hypothetical protein